ncbi:capping protein inhibiting regulator of actin dynamics-like [Rana temporaria]|uniref:capping protein inhibiting regulator of actin dynamics-like n=1 Tax=Rana temporaria TaxID=8407 RepID=UPI001AADB9E0|nr:capping protein inhibiting regulator of actin dynamics-like [Rana temporaria]
MDMDELKHVINSFSFDRCKKGNQGFNRCLIQLFGLAGHGKSSFINTCVYVWQDGEYKNWAKAAEGYGGKTTERIPHKITSNITLVDNRGWPKLDGYGSGEIFAQLGNLLPLGRGVEFTKGFGLVEKIVRSEKLVKDSDFIAPVFVHSVKHIIPTEEIEELKSVLHTAREMTGIYPIVVLTHKTYGNLTTVESSFRDMGIERIFAFENYTQEDHFKTRGRHEEVLKFLQEVIKDAQFRVEHQTRNPVKEMHDRKQFVMNYVHQREKKMEQEGLERKKALDRAMREKELKRQEEEFERERQRRKEAEEAELRKRREELERQRSAEQARYVEIQAQQQANAKGGKKFLGFFSKKK